MADRLDWKELEIWAMTSWSLWNARNCFHFEKQQTHPEAILRVATSLLDEYQQLSLSLPHRWTLLCVYPRLFTFILLYFLFFLFSFLCSLGILLATVIGCFSLAYPLCSVLYFFSSINILLSHFSPKKKEKEISCSIKKNFRISAICWLSAITSFKE